MYGHKTATYRPQDGRNPYPVQVISGTEDLMLIRPYGDAPAFFVPRNLLSDIS
jgi:hypothetical protein